MGYPFNLYDNRDKGLYGAASYMGWLERLAYLSRFNQGLRLGSRNRISSSDSFMNLFLLGPTGSGKSTRIYIPNLLTLKDTCAVVTDPSGEIFANTSGWLQRQGYRVLIFSPLHPESSLRLNPLQHFSTEKELKQFAHFIVGQRAKDREDVFWDPQAINIINIVFHLLKAHFPPEKHTLAQTALLIDQLNREKERKQIEDLICRPETPELIFNKWRSFRAQDEKVFLGGLSTASVSLDYWTEESVAAITSSSSGELEGFRDRKTVLYVMSGEDGDEVEYFQPLLNVFYTALFRATLKGHIPPAQKDITFFLDEMANIGAIQGFPNIVTTSRKKRSCFCMALQDREQLDALYGPHGANAIFYGGCQNKLYLGGLSNPRTLRELQELLGTRTAVDSSNDGHDRKVSQNLESCAELRMIPDQRAVLISKNRRPIWLKCEPYYKSWRMVSRSRIPPAQLNRP